MSDFQDYVQGLQMLGGVLALPRSAQYAQEDALAHRRMLEGTGIDPADIQAMYPDAPLGFLRAGGPGIGSKILGGVGDVGALISTIAGRPVGPPRLGISDVAQASKLRSSFKEQRALDELAKTETDPTAKALLATGSMDGYARYKSAQLRGAQTPPWRGTPGESTTLRLDAERAGRAAQRGALIAAGNDPKDVDRWIAVGGSLAGPKEPPDVTLTKRHDATMALREKDAQKLGIKPGTDEYNYFMSTGRPPLQRAGAKDLDYNFFFKQALEQEQRRAASDFDEVNMDTVKKNADTAWGAYDNSRKDRGGTTPPGAETPPPGQPPPRAQTPPPPSKPGTQLPIGPPAGGSEVVGPQEPLVGPTPQTGEQAAAAREAARAQVRQMLVPPGGRGTPPTPAIIAQNMPDLWAAAGLSGLESMSREELLSYVTPGAAAPEAGQAPQQTEQGQQAGGGLGVFQLPPVNQWTPDQIARVKEIKAQKDAGKLDALTAQQQTIGVFKTR